MVPEDRPDITIRMAGPGEDEAVWQILEPMLRAGETYPLPRDWPRADALAYWMGAGHEVFVAVAGERVLGTYYLRANHLGGGSHVANCGYVSARAVAGSGIGRAMCAHSLDRARARGFRAMQFNFVVATNARAVRLWRGFGFTTVGVLPAAFDHPSQGPVDALVMHRAL